MVVEEANGDQEPLEIPGVLRERLAQLPVFDPPPIRQRPRRGALGTRGWQMPVALAAGLVLMVAVLDRSERAPDAADAGVSPMDRQLAQWRPRQPTRDALRVEFELASLEARLQRAQEGERPVPEAMWSQRLALQRELLALYRAPSIERM